MSMRSAICIIAAVLLLPSKSIAQQNSNYPDSIDYSSPLGNDGHFASSATQQVEQFAEAEAQLKNSDCSIARSQSVIENYQTKLRAITQRIAPIIAERDATIANTLSALENTFGSPIDPTASSVESLEKMGWVFSARLAGTLRAAAEALVLLKAASGYFSISSAQHKINLASLEFEYVREQIAYRGDLLKADWQRRDALVASWENRGVRFQRAFYGTPEDCQASNNTFDGTWGRQGLNEADYVIRASTFRILKPREFKYTGYCLANYSEFRYLSQSTAEVNYHNVCPDGSQGQRGRLRFALRDDEVLVSDCTWQPNEPPAHCPDPASIGISLERFSQ